MLAEYSVHTLMAGYTNCSVGMVGGYSAIIPIDHIASTKPHLITWDNPNWQRLLQSTGQPAFLNEKIN